jgi:hypothetical protein
MDELQFAFMYLLLQARERGEYMPLSMFRMLLDVEVKDERVVALSLENLGLVECSVDERMTGNARYKYKLTPGGLEVIKDILRAPGAKVVHVVHKDK